MGCYNQNFEKKQKQKKMFMVLIVFGVIVGALALLFIGRRSPQEIPINKSQEKGGMISDVSGADRGDQDPAASEADPTEREMKSSAQKNEFVNHFIPERGESLIPETLLPEQIPPASGGDEQSLSENRAEEEARAKKRTAIKGKIEHYINYQMGSLAKDFTSFAFSCKPPEYQLEVSDRRQIEDTSRPRNKFLYPDWNSETWIDFFSAVYDYYRENRSLFNSRSYQFRSRQTNHVGFVCRSKLTGFASSLKKILDSFSVIEEEARKLGLYPGDIRDIMDELDFDIHDVERLLSILEDCAEAFC